MAEQSGIQSGMETNSKGSAKRPYSKPKFTIYGDIKTLTLAIMGGSGNIDNNTGMSMQKTSPA